MSRHIFAIICDTSKHTFHPIISFPKTVREYSV